MMACYLLWIAAAWGTVSEELRASNNGLSSCLEGWESG